MLKKLWARIAEARRLPQIVIDLRCAGTAGNDPFFERIVRQFHAEASSRHPKFPLVRRYEYGFSVCCIGPDFEHYFQSIEGAARRNYRKSLRLGYNFQRIDFNAYLDDVTAIRRSADMRQGRPMPQEFFSQPVSRNHNPASNTSLHDYPYVGIVRDGTLYAFAGCLVAGDLCSIQTIYGHADFQGDGVVPMLIIGIAQHIFQQYPDVKFYAYGTYFGASETMRRFKRKFGFLPHRVQWRLGD